LDFLGLGPWARLESPWDDQTKGAEANVHND
jgi:hypothetical protein